MPKKDSAVLSQPYSSSAIKQILDDVAVEYIMRIHERNALGFYYKNDSKHGKLELTLTSNMDKYDEMYTVGLLPSSLSSRSFKSLVEGRDVVSISKSVGNYFTESGMFQREAFLDDLRSMYNKAVEMLQKKAK